MSMILLEGWKEIGEFLGLHDPAGESTRKRLLAWEEREGLPVRRHLGRIFADPVELKTWASSARFVAETPNK